MKLLRSFLLVALVLAGLAALALWQLPDRWEVTRSIVIAAPPSAVHAQVADLVAWEQWSPFEQQHPDMRFEYSPVTQGLDARRDWTSPSLGDGWMQITAADPRRGVWYDIGFVGSRPFKGVLLYEVLPADLDATAQQPTQTLPQQFTRVHWTSAGDVTKRALFRFTLPLMDEIFGPTFEQGLSNLKLLVEGQSPPSSL